MSDVFAGMITAFLGVLYLIIGKAFASFIVFVISEDFDWPTSLPQKWSNRLLALIGLLALFLYPLFIALFIIAGIGMAIIEGVKFVIGLFRRPKSGDPTVSERFIEWL